jgi:CHAT domain-containing protein/tetratricopeptide (TPR) repeat protein
MERTELGIQRCRSLAASPWPASFQLLKAEILLAQSRLADARPLLENPPAEVAQSAGLKARLLMNLAELQKQSGRQDEARSLLTQARDLAAHAGDSPLVAWIELRRGALLADFDEADAAFHRALDIARSQSDDFLAAGALGNLGYIRLRRFRYDEAIPWFEAADRAAQKIPSKMIHEKNLGNLGWCYFRLGQLDRALEFFSRAEPIAAKASLVDDQQRWLGNIGAIYYEREVFDKAISYYSRARDIAAGLGNRTYAANWLNNITRAYIDQSNWEAAEKFNRLASEALAGAADAQWVEAFLRLNSGFIATARARAGEAEQDFHEAIQLAKESYQPIVAWQAHSGLALLYHSQSRASEAGKEYAAAMDLLDREWLALRRDESKISFRNYLAIVYQDYVGFLSERNQREKALEVAESSRARLLAQKLEGRSAALPIFRAAQAVRLARESGAVLLSYWLAPKQSYLWAVNAKGVSQFTLPGESAIAALVTQHRRSIDSLQDPLASGSAAARQLYKILLGPVEPLVHAAGQVLIVPDGRLHELNFETLVADVPKPHYWIEDAMIALVPSLSVLRSWKTDPARRPRLLIIGDPLPADPEFPPLAHLKTEIREIAAGFPEPDRAVYTGAQAYPELLRETNPRAFTAIHFAAHATANDESPLNSAIILSPHLSKYKLYASEVADLRLEPELVTISACRSAGSKAYSGEGLVGFSWAFLEAGAHNVVAGIWNVDDAAAPQVMEEFYKEWRADGNPAAALRNAKLKLLHTGGVFSKPYYWGPFEIFTRQVTRSAMDLAWRNSSR